ncbi:MAG: cytochrome c-type biogenesis protein CcmH [Gammaproteobacteria bacterium]|nr:cytochrome c-type biogenesis protein CcmH [Gammaproteobacteria bacterium]
MKSAVVAILLGLLALPVFAKDAVPLLDSAIDEERYKALTSELRCQKCQNQTIYDSKAGLADDLKRVVREQMKQGKTDNEIVDYMVARYGDFIRYKPAFKSSTMFLWIGPFILLIIGVTMLFVQLRKRRLVAADDVPLSAEDTARVEELLKK